MNIGISIGIGKGGARRRHGLKAAMQSQRVDFNLLGDSNALFGGVGWDGGFHLALAEIAPTFGTGLVSINENAGSGGGCGQGYSALRIGATLAATGAPAEVGKYISKGSGDLGPLDYGYTTSTLSSTAQLGINIKPEFLGDITKELRYDLYTGTFDSGSGRFRLFHRLADNTGQINGPLVSTNTGVLGDIVRTSMTRPAIGAAPAVSTQFMAQQLGWVNNGATPIIGPFFTTYQRVTIPEQTTGWAFSTLYGKGGQSMRDCAYALQQASDETLTHWFSIQRADQIEAGATSPVIVLLVCFGLNDRNETLTSVGPGEFIDADSPEAYVDNFVAIRQRIEAIWTLNGWAASELKWLVMPSHARSDPDDAEVVAYRSALQIYASTMPNAEFVDLAALVPPATMASSNYYDAGGNDHLSTAITPTAYEQIADVVVAAIR